MNKNDKFKELVATSIFASKWLLLPFYFGLFVSLGVYAWVYIKEIIHLVSETKTITKELVMLSTLELVDIVMIANLVKMIITGSYHSFVDKDHGESTENLGSGMLKVKMSTSLVGVSSIHLLQTFIHPHHKWEDLQKQLWIHGMFLVGSLILAIIDFLHHKSEQHDDTEKSAGH